MGSLDGRHAYRRHSVQVGNNIQVGTGARRVNKCGISACCRLGCDHFGAVKFNTDAAGGNRRDGDANGVFNQRLGNECL